MPPVKPLILIVEDSEDARFLVASILSFEGFATDCAENGEAALQRLNTGNLPAIILLDLSMPVMDGFAFLRHQAADTRLADIPVVVHTAEHRSSWPTVWARSVVDVVSKFAPRGVLLSAVRAAADIQAA